MIATNLIKGIAFGGFAALGLVLSGGDASAGRVAYGDQAMSQLSPLCAYENIECGTDRRGKTMTVLEEQVKGSGYLTIRGNRRGWKLLSSRNSRQFKKLSRYDISTTATKHTAVSRTTYCDVYVTLVGSSVSQRKVRKNRRAANNRRNRRGGGMNCEGHSVSWLTSGSSSFTSPLGGTGGTGGSGGSGGETFSQSQFTAPVIGSISQGGAAGRVPEFTVPEPATLTLVGLGLAGLGLYRRRKSD